MVGADVAWMIVASALVLLMTPALAFFYGGLVRSKNALNTMMMSFVSLGVLGFAEIGYRRLEFANRAMSAALEMETAVNETLALIGEAESGQRGYLLTGDPSYLKPYKMALPKIDQTFARLRELVSANGTAVMIDHAGQLNGLIGKKLNELESTLALNERSGREAAFQLIDTGLGQKLMEDIRGQAQSILDELRESSRRGGRRWAQDIEFGRVGTFLAGPTCVDPKGIGFKRRACIGVERPSRFFRQTPQPKRAKEPVRLEGRGTQNFGEPAKPCTPNQFHLPEAVLGRRIPLPEPGVVLVFGADVRQAKAVAIDAHRGAKPGDARFAVHLRDGPREVDRR